MSLARSQVSFDAMEDAQLQSDAADAEVSLCQDELMHAEKVAEAAKAASYVKKEAKAQMLALISAMNAEIGEKRKDVEHATAVMNASSMAPQQKAKCLQVRTLVQV